ncbi:MAG: type II toxin-antitoxin system VapC family toxin [Brachybacterium sp.]|nr:type II toxin-antitoxin system VapC family toxin [Brachybacterium sp.]
MSFLLDTNVITELRKSERRAEPQVREWASRRSPAELHLSVITILEIEVGIGRLHQRDPTQARRLQAWLDDDLLEVFAGRILPVDLDIARYTARMHVPDPRPERDVLIAATASVRGLHVVTRNVSDFAPLGVSIVDPWLPEAET